MTTVTEELESVSDSLLSLSRRYAGEGDVRRAELAAWACDVHALEALLWENGLGQAPDPGAQLATVGEAVASSLESLATTPGRLTARQVVESAREAMVTTFDESVHGLLSDRLAGLGHLDDCQPTAVDADLGPAQRLAGRTPDGLVAELRAAAADCMAVAQLLAGEGEDAAADRLARQSDVACFEAHLVTMAVLAGDQRLATVDLRWELAADLPLSGSRDDRRAGMAGLVGAAEADQLWGSFETLPPR